MIVPVLLLLTMTVMTAMFYYHDKVIMEGAARETVVKGALRSDMEEADLKKECQRLLKNKMIWFPKATVSVSKKKTTVSVHISAQHRMMKTETTVEYAVTKPEQWLRGKENLDEYTLQK